MTSKGKPGLPLLVALVGFVLVAVLAGRDLATVERDATLFVGFGEGATPTRLYAEERLGEVILRPNQGHDGKFFFVQANDPWLIDPGENAEILDLPRYRSQRMLYPALAGGFGLIGPEGIIWGLLATNLVAMAMGTWGAAVVARSLGGSPWLGLAFTLNVGFVSVIYIAGAGILAAAAAFWALAAMLDRRWYWGIGLLAVAGLTREVMLIAAAGAAWWLWMEGRRQLAIAAALIPTSVVAVWAMYLRLRLEGDEMSAGAIGWPFVGLANAIPEWLGDPLTVWVGFGMVLLMVLYVRQVFTSNSLLGWAFFGFVPLASLLTENVWTSYFDFARALAPVITAFVILMFVGRLRTQDAGDEVEINQLPSIKATK